MSYVLTILKHLAKSKYCQNLYSAKNIVDLRKVSRKKTLAIQRNKQNKNYDAGKRSKKYQEEKQKKAKLPKNTNSNIVAQVDMIGTNHNEVLTLHSAPGPTKNFFLRIQLLLIKSLGLCSNFLSAQIKF